MRVASAHAFSASPEEEAFYLKMLVHLVGDLHQPMHAGDMADRGGNDVAANYGLLRGSRLNLHAIFDGYLAERAFTTPPGGAGGMVSAYDRASLDAFKLGDVQFFG